MAINPESEFVGKIAASTVEYPYGSARDITLPGDGTGTPWKAVLVNDLFGFQQSLLDEASIVPSGSPDEVGASQYLQALKSISGSRVADYVGMRALDSSTLMDYQIITITDDGVSGNFKIKTGTVTDNGGTLIVFTDDPARYAERIFAGPTSVKWFGTVGDGVADDTTPVAAAIASAMTVLFPEGTYMCSFSQRHGQKIYGDGSRVGGTTLIPPAAATHVIEIDATSTAKQHCIIENIQLSNPNSVANCDGIHFKGTDVTTINDRHHLSDIAISDFRYGVKVTGRMIRAQFESIATSGCTRGLYVDADPASYAFNLNTFINCRFGSSVAEGVRIEGFNVANKFISPNIEGNNTDNVAGIAGMYVENAESLFIDNPYFELNGGSVVVDAGDRMNNSIGLQLGGVRCFNLNVTGGWMVQSGTIIAIDDTVSVWGGSIKGVRFIALVSGIDVYINGKVDAHDRPTIQIDGDNYFTRGVEIVEQPTGRYAGSIKQVQGGSYITSASDVDLAAVTSLTANSATAFTISTMLNRVPGCTFTLYNHGAGAITLDSALMANGIAEVIPSKATKEYLVLGFPNGGELREVGSTALTEVTTGITASNTGAQGGAPLTSKINEISVVGSSAWSTTLPDAVAAHSVLVINTSATSVKVFPASGDDLGAGVNISVPLAGGANITYTAYDATNWVAVT